MPTSTIAVFTKPQAFEAALQHGSRVEFLVTGYGEFRAQLTSIALPQIRLSQATEWVSRIAVVSVAPGSMLVMLPTEPESSQKFGGASLLAGEIMTVTAGEPFYTWTIGSCGWRMISVLASEFAGYGKALVGRKFALPSGVCRLRPGRGRFQSLVSLFNASMRLTKAQPSRPIETEGAARGLEQEVVRVLVDCLSTATMQTSNEASQNSIIMARLDRLLQTYPHEIPRSREICAALGISVKALRACCQQQVGVGTGRYLQLRGIRRVHHALIGSHPGQDSVAGIAKCYGFNAPGRFAAAYRRQFGELPSATLRRGPGPVAIRAAGADRWHRCYNPDP